MDNPFDDKTIPEIAGRYFEGRKVFGGRFVLKGKLGQGGMGQVWLALDTELAIEVALKFTAPELAGDTKAEADLRRAVTLGRELTHPGIVRVYDFHADEREAAISMEYMPGKNLSEWQVETPNDFFEAREIHDILVKICEVLDYAHQVAKRSHRDIKPKNIMLDMATGTVKLADFDIGRRLSDTFSRNTGKESSGSLPYMGPQQLLGENSRVQDDVYSLGATIYELLTGTPPFYQGDIREQIKHVIPTSMAQRRRDLFAEQSNLSLGEAIPQEWENVVAACLHKDREHRPVSGAELLSALSRLPQSPASKSPRSRVGDHAFSAQEAAAERAVAVPSASPRNKPLRWIIAACLVLGLGAWGMFSSTKPAAQDPAVAQIRVEQDNLKQEQARLKQEQADASVAQQRQAESLRLQQEQLRKDKEAVDARAKAADEKASKAKQAEEQRLAKLATATTGPVAASKETPFVNSLGMKFVPIDISMGNKPVLFSIWETRVKDFAEFAQNATGYRYEDGSVPQVWSGETWEYKTGMSWKIPGFAQTDAHPVTCVSWEDADKFCKWLTEKEHAAGKIGLDYIYRLPTDAEWSCAVGIGEKEASGGFKTPKEKHNSIAYVFPWNGGNGTWPPPKGAGNYRGQETNTGGKLNTWNMLDGYDDGYETTSPVGSFGANAHDLYDLGGNVNEWCEDWYDNDAKSRVLRGCSWNEKDSHRLLSTSRTKVVPTGRSSCIGFRCVLVLSD